MFITVSATAALISAGINLAAVAVAGYAGYRYLGKRYETMKDWIAAHDDAQRESRMSSREEENP